MPNVQSETTKDLITYLIEGTNYEPADIGAELQYRLILDDYEAEELRGGVRPTHQPLNP